MCVGGKLDVDLPALSSLPCGEHSEHLGTLCQGVEGMQEGGQQGGGVQPVGILASPGAYSWESSEDNRQSAHEGRGPVGTRQKPVTVRRAEAKIQGTGEAGARPGSLSHRMRSRKRAQHVRGRRGRKTWGERAAGTRSGWKCALEGWGGVVGESGGIAAELPS